MKREGELAAGSAMRSCRNSLPEHGGLRPKCIARVSYLYVLRANRQEMV